MGVDLSACSHHAIAHVLLRIRSVDELLEALHLDAQFLALQVLELYCSRLGGTHILRRGFGDGASVSQHAGDRSATLPDGAGPTRLSRCG